MKLDNPYQALADYLTADYGQDLRVFPDGAHDLAPSNTYEVGPCVRIKCPGIGQLDSTYFTEGFVDRDDSGTYCERNTGRPVGDLAAVIRECVRDGDVEDLLKDMLDALTKALEA